MIYRIEIYDKDGNNVLIHGDDNWGVMEQEPFQMLSYRFGMNFEEDEEDSDEVSYYQAKPMVECCKTLNLRQEFIDEVQKVADDPENYREMYPFTFVQE